MPVRALAFAAAFLAALNAAICREMFYTEYLRRMDSIEGAYIGISRYILEHPHDWNWFPLWYGGVPFQNSYPPLLHMMVAAVAWIAHISPALSHHIVSGTFYCLGPVALMFLAYALSKNFKLSFAAGLMMSLISPAPFLMPSVRADLGSVFRARRLETLAVYGDGPHGSSVTMLLLAILALHWAIEKRGPWRAFVTAVAFAAVVLTNWLGAFSLAIAVICYLTARLSQDRDWIGYVAAIGLIAYGFAAPWIPPSTIADIQRNAQFTIGNYPMGATQATYWALLFIAGAVLARVMAKASFGLRFSALLALAMAALALPPEWTTQYLMPQGERYQLEMEIGICLTLILGLGGLLLRAPKRVQTAMAVVLILCAAVQVRTYRRYARGIMHPVDIRQTVEYQSATWLEQNLPSGRVFASGSIQFWLNAFSDTAQLGGGFGQGMHDPFMNVAHFGIPYLEKNGEASAAWLRILGAQAVVVSGPTGRDAFNHDWRDPDKFNGVLPEVWRNGGDVIYRVPQRSAGLAHVIFPSDVPPRTPPNLEEMDPVRLLAVALENPALPTAQFTWIEPSVAAISTSLRPEHLVFVQIAYHPGWHATVNGEPRPITRDPLGFMLIEPRCSGPCEIRLQFDGGLEMTLSKVARALAIVAMIAWIAISRLSSRRSPFARRS